MLRHLFYTLLIHIFIRLLQKKSKTEVKQVQNKLNNVHNVLNFLLSIQNHLHSQNTIDYTKVLYLFLITNII